MRRAMLASAVLAMMGGVAHAGSALHTYVGCIGAFGADHGCVYPADSPPVSLDGRIDWKEASKRASGQTSDQDVIWSRALLAARLDGWRAAGGKGEPPE